ncbi:hypothetical protein [Carboxylicivirga caseinilyticus]|uniref:hypothetical protein n=1 Tax=Carboxylicivirga caseinilyticus TaxID=3417572 RepID=UPI002AA84713|nr:hypothetical protein [uncultured Carboxylicivirga sp.]MCU4165908.1 hypothetical protein [Marinilabiliaceae bacterium A049]
MSKQNLSLHVVLESDEYIKVSDHVYTTKASLLNEETKLHLIDTCCLNILKEFEGELTQPIVEEWLLLSKALDQSCNYENSWDDRKMLKELIDGKSHSVSWYALHCKVS